MEVFEKNQGRAVARPKQRPARLTASLVLAGALHLTSLSRIRGEDRGDYRYEDYAEDGGRIHIQTHGVYFDAEVRPWISLKGNYIHDAISGATPTGAPPLPGRNKVEKVTIDDIRNAGFIEAGMKYRNHTFSPQIAYSEEHDYKSIGISLTHAIELNEKNTTVSWGLSHSADEVLPNDGATIRRNEDKNTTDFLLGLNQLLGPKTILTANLTLGYSEGYLSDPYKRVLFDDFPYTPGNPYTVFPEKRPDHKFRQVAYLSLQQYVDPLHGAAEVSYRFHHDDFGVLAHTVSAQWNQKIGKHVIVSPLFRYHTQSEADFYGTHFPGDPTVPGSRLPDYYSADYRLSALESFTYGVSISARVHEHVSLEFSYKRYEMFGTDGATSSDQYPKAHVFTGGVTVWF
ncbi:MAG TPA: DUF3570 domain-containing protein [Candidatus Acidoferrum sp.]|nr:DUF3570 domain-containing protein [Candidatus Acidoferrum sp.]